MCAAERRSPRARAIAPALLLALAAALALAAVAPRQAASPRTLAEGEGKAIAERACLICHSAMLITQQRKDRAAWERSIAQMQKWGAPVDSAARDTLAGWLAKVYGAPPK